MSDSIKIGELKKAMRPTFDKRKKPLKDMMQNPNVKKVAPRPQTSETTQDDYLAYKRQQERDNY